MSEQENQVLKEELIPVEDIGTQQKPEKEKRSDSVLDELMAFVRKNRRAFAGALAGILFACLCMWIGFWRTLFITVMALLGIFLFSVDDKQGAIKRFIGKIFPHKE